VASQPVASTAPSETKRIVKQPDVFVNEASIAVKYKLGFVKLL